MNSAPRVSVIIPSYNHARFIRHAIDSVLTQDYELITVLVMDGGSTDGTVDILKSYGDRISFISRKDRGQSDAINQGLRAADGEIACWLNSDDAFTPHAMRIVADAFAQHPAASFVYGRGWNTDEAGHILGDAGVLPFDLWRLIHQRNFIQQPSCFFRTSLLREVGLLDEHLHYVMDWEFWIRCSTHVGLYIDEYLSYNRTYAGNKTQSGQWRRWREIRDMIRRYTTSRWPPVLILYALEAMIQSLRARPWSTRLDLPLCKLFSWGVAQEMSGRYPDGSIEPVFHFSIPCSTDPSQAVKVRLTPLSRFDFSEIGKPPILIKWASTTGDSGAVWLEENGCTQEFTLVLSRRAPRPFIHFRCRAKHPGRLIEAGTGLPRRRVIGFMDDAGMVGHHPGHDCPLSRREDAKVGCAPGPRP